MKSRSKMLLVLAPLLGLAAFFALPAASQAGDRYGRDCHQNYYRHYDYQNSYGYSPYEYQRRDCQPRYRSNYCEPQYEVRVYRQYEPRCESPSPIVRHIERHVEVHRALHNLIFGH